MTSISRQGTDVVLSWPSTPGQKFIVQVRDSFDPGSSWRTLTNGLPAAATASATTFIHPGVLPGGGAQMHGASGPTTVKRQLSPEEIETALAERKAEAEKAIAWLTAMIYEASAKPKAGSEAGAKNPAPLSVVRPRRQEPSAILAEQSTDGCAFYRVFIPNPIARLDIFGVNQNSATNQLGILANDEDPEDYFFQLSAVTSAGHGTLDYTDSASIFRYTPVGGFAGPDSFTYSVTNEVGGLASATAWVFVNQSGNHHPSAPPLSLTLSSNLTQITFPILTNTLDADGDQLSFVVLLSPSRGTAVTNADGTLTYTRTSEIPDRDEFCYVLTDDRGGFVKRQVVLLQQDTDGDGMPDEWEVRYGLNPTVNDAQADPDGDGLPNLAEYKMRSNPQIPDNPLSLAGIPTGQVFTGYARIPLALNPGINREPVGLLLNGEPSGSLLRQGADGSWYLSLDTGYMTNGNYSAALSFQFDPQAQSPTPDSTVGPTNNLRVTNEVIFDQLNSEFSDIWFINVTFAYTNADWRIELYDEDGYGPVYFDGTTADGNVQGWWDLTIEGEQIFFGSILAYVYVAPAGQGLPPVGSGLATANYVAPAGQDLSAVGSGLAKAKRWFTKQVPGGVGNTFVVAWGWENYGSSFVERRTDLMLQGVINIIGNPSLSDEYQLRPGFNVPYGNAFRYDDDMDAEILKTALASMDSGNFFWFGHGTSDRIQGNGKKSSITQILALELSDEEQDHAGIAKVGL